MLFAEPFSQAAENNLWGGKGSLYWLLLLCCTGGMGVPLAESQPCYRTTVFSQTELLLKLEEKPLVPGVESPRPDWSHLLESYAVVHTLFKNFQVKEDGESVLGRRAEVGTRDTKA